MFPGITIKNWYSNDVLIVDLHSGVESITLFVNDKLFEIWMGCVSLEYYDTTENIESFIGLDEWWRSEEMMETQMVILSEEI